MHVYHIFCGWWKTYGFGSVYLLAIGINLALKLSIGLFSVILIKCFSYGCSFLCGGAVVLQQLMSTKVAWGHTFWQDSDFAISEVCLGIKLFKVCISGGYGSVFLGNHYK